MKRIILLFLLTIINCTLLISCVEQDDGFDDSKYSNYEKPQTATLYDGHELSSYEQMAKYIVENGTYTFDTKLDGLGYSLKLSTSDEYDMYAFYTINVIKLAKVYSVRNTSYITYIRLTDEAEDTFNAMYKIIYPSSRKQDFYAILINYKNGESSTTDDFELYRGDITTEKDETMTTIITETNQLLTSFNDLIKKKINMSLSSLNFSQYK
jgi:hypothetical protein